MKTRSTIRTLAGLGATAMILALASLSAGCQLAVDFNRALIDAGIDGAFFDAGDGGEGTLDAGVDGAIDAAPAADAAADVGTGDAKPAIDAHADATGDGGTKG